MFFYLCIHGSLAVSMKISFSERNLIKFSFVGSTRGGREWCVGDKLCGSKSDRNNSLSVHKKYLQNLIELRNNIQRLKKVT